MTVPSLSVQTNGGPGVSGDQLNTYEQTCDNAAQLRGLVGVTGLQVYARGTNSPNDGGQGVFYWNASGTAPDDNGVTTIAPFGSGSGVWTRIGTAGSTGIPVISPTGTASDIALLTLASSNGPFVMATGTYLVPSNLTLSAGITMVQGAVFSVGNGATLTLNGVFTAPIAQVFTGLGAVKLSSLTHFVYAEWFGALCNGSNNDALAINAAILAMSRSGGVLQLLCRQYNCVTTITVGTFCLTIQGIAIGMAPIDYGGGQIEGTQLIGTNGVKFMTVTCAYFTLKDLDAYLLVGATTATIGVDLQSCLLAKVLDCRITNFSTGVYANGCTDCYVERCYITSTAVTVSPVIGIDVNSVNGTANPSLHITECVSAHGSYTTLAYGYYIHGQRISDTWLDNCEADGCTYCYFVDGSTAVGGYSADIHIRGCVADQTVTYGFYVLSFGTDSQLEIVNGWSAGAATNQVFVDGSSARVRVSGMQLYGGGTGVYIKASQQCIVSENLLNYQGAEGITIDNSVACTISNNQGWQKTAAGIPFIHALTGSTYGSYIGNSANGTTGGAWSDGIKADVGADYINVFANNMPPSVITSPYTLNLGSNTHSVKAGT